jgi:hypothetical protein
LDAKIKEYAMEREQLKIELGQAMRDRGEQTLKGKQFSVTQNQETKEIEFRDLSGELP